LEASATKRQLVLSWHSLRCANYPFNACALNSLQLSFKPLLLLFLLAGMGVNGPDAYFLVSFLAGLF
jgi:hypothetical protein